MISAEQAELIVAGKLKVKLRVVDDKDECLVEPCLARLARMNAAKTFLTMAGPARPVYAACEYPTAVESISLVDAATHRELDRIDMRLHGGTAIPRRQYHFHRYQLQVIVQAP